MSRKLVVLMVLILAGCGGLTGSGSPGAETGSEPGSSEPGSSEPGSSEPGASEAPGGSAVTDVEWDRPAEGSPELCPPDGEPTEKPAFGEPVGFERQGFGGVAQHGIVANRDGELFRMDVIGPDEDSVRQYTSEVRVCFDHIFTGPGEPEDVDGVPPEEEPAPEPFGANAEDLLIEVQILGFVDPAAADPAGVVAEVGARGVDEWAAMLVERQAAPEIAREAELGTDYLIDFVIDPLVGSGTHHYAERRATKVWVRLSTIQGRVLGGLCRSSSYPFRRADVGYNVAGISSTETISDTQSYSSTYDLGVKGNSSGRYRVSGAWGYAGWFAGYWDWVPPGSYRNCYP